jgi:hypothetical protein
LDCLNFDRWQSSETVSQPVPPPRGWFDWSSLTFFHVKIVAAVATKSLHLTKRQIDLPYCQKTRDF